ncbi:uncharacterized protein PHA67_000416 isoform 3-T5 [Liasis olivaceus]
MAATKLGIFLLLPVILQWVTGVTAAELIVYYEEYENSIIRYNGSGDFEDYYYDNSTYDYKEDWLKTNNSTNAAGVLLLHNCCFLTTVLHVIQFLQQDFQFQV